jgi:hypothetical protein
MILLSHFIFAAIHHYRTAVTAVHQVNDASIPVHNDLTVRIKPSSQYLLNGKIKLLSSVIIVATGSVRKAEWLKDAFN